MIQAKFGLNWPSGFRGEDFLKSLQMDDGRQIENLVSDYRLLGVSSCITFKKI
jgi:hypothetical protein